MTRFTILLFLFTSAYAEDSPKPQLPEAAIKVMAQHDADVAKADATAAKALEKVLGEVMKKGDLDGAEAIKAKIDELKPKSNDPFKQLQIVSAKYGVEGRWFDATHWIQDKVKNGVLKFQGIDGLPDPAFGSVKVFVITYTINGVQKTKTFNQNALVEIKD